MRLCAAGPLTVEAPAATAPTLQREAFQFSPRQLSLFEGLAFSMRNCSISLLALAVGNVFIHAFETVEHHHAHAHHAEAGAAGGAAAPSALALLGETLNDIALSDVAFCVNALIPAALIYYSHNSFAALTKSPGATANLPQAFQGLGRMSLTLQQLAWTSGSVGVVLLLEAAVKYPPMVGVASGTCLALAAARGAALWWVVQQHTTSGEEVSRTLAALRGGKGAPDIGLLDRAASWLALGALLQAEPPIHRPHGEEDHHSHAGETAGGASAAAAAAVADAHYSFDSEEERVLRSLVEAGNVAGLAISLQVLATLALGVAEAATGDTPGMVSHFINATQKTANSLLLFACSGAFDRALHNEDGKDDVEHLMDGLGRGHAGLTGLFTSMAVLNWALLGAGGLELLVPALDDSPLGVLVGDTALHASADVLVEVLEAL